MNRLPYLIFISIFLCVCGMQAHSQSPAYQNLDPSTQKALDQLNQYISRGQPQQAVSRLQEIISNSGYIKPLAYIYYRLAQNDELTQNVVRYYTAMIQNWPDSAWAQKATIELIPILIMSDGRLGSKPESIVWEHVIQLLKLSDDAPTIGEKADMLLDETHHHMLKLASTGNDQNLVRRIAGLGPNDSRYQTHNRLMVISSYIRSQEWEEARRRLNDWLQAFPQSEFKPSALVLLHQCAQDQQERRKIIEQLQSEFSNSLELKQLQ